jgi:hypothetical protein
MTQSWSREMHLHFYRHFGPGMTAVYLMPCQSFDERVQRALAAFRLYQRVCLHIERMRPADGLEPLQEAAKGEGVG